MSSRQQLKQLQLALINAFPSKSSLEQLLYFELEKNLNEITKDSNLQDIVFNLIQIAETQGWLVDLVRAARKENPGNSQLQVIAGELLSPKAPSVPIHTALSEQSQQRQKQLITPTSDSGLNPPPNEVIESQSTTNERNDLDDDLSSAANVDYTKLRNFLKAGQWKEADYETYLVMLSVVGRRNGDWIRAKELSNFKSTDLRTIDSLWVKYSNGRFGFSVQKKIYLDVGGKPDGRYDEGAWKKFGDAIGWRVEGNWIGYDDVTFDTIAPQGHLPIYRYTRIYRYTLGLNKTNEINNRRWGLGAGAVGGVAGLFSRIQACKL